MLKHLLGCMLLCVAGSPALQAQALMATAPAFESAVKSHGRQSQQRSIIYPRTQSPNARVAMKAASGNTVTLCGNVIDALSWYEEGGSATPGIWSVPVTSSPTETVIAEGPNGNYGAVAMKDQYLTITYDKVTRSASYTFYDMSEWMVIKEGKLDMPFETIDMAYDATSETVYAVFCDVRGYYSFGTLNTDYMWNMPLKTLDAPWWGLAFNEDGELYAIDGEGDVLKVDKTNGSTTKLFSTGISSRIKGGAVIVDDTMYYEFVGPYSSVFYAINLNDGSYSEVCTIPDAAEMVGLYVAPVQADPNSPAAVTSFTGDFEANSLEGSITFTAPTTLYDGTPYAGQLTYTVSLNGEEFATGTVSAGADITLPVTVDKAGIYLFEVYTSANGLDGVVKKLRVFIGPDTPTAPVDVKAVYADGVMHVTWAPPAVGVDGGALDPDEVTYTVRQFSTLDPDGTIVAAGQKAYSLDIRMAMPDNLTAYWYEVTAVNLDRLESAPGTSARLMLGNIVPPYFQNFADQSSFDGFTILNNNGDSFTWGWSAGHAEYQMGYTRADDWLITNPIYLKAGEAYEISARVGRGSTFTGIERIEAAIGTSPTIDGMTGEGSTIVIEPYDIYEVMSWGVGGETARGRFIPETDGVYYLGFHAISDAFRGWLYLTDIDIAAGVEVTAPEAVSGLTATPDQSGELQVTVSFSSPTTDVAGNQLSSLEMITVKRGGTIVKTFNPAAPGTAYSFTDRNAAYGLNEYSVYCSNASGNGPVSSCSAFAGYAKPLDVESLTGTHGSNDGEVVLEWTPVTEDVNGLPFAPGKVTYTLLRADMNGNQTIVAEGLTDTTYTDQAVAADADQQFVFYGVFALDEAGNSENAAMTDFIPVGKPMTMPFDESFANGRLSHPAVASQDWILGNDSSFASQASADGDNGFLICDSPAWGVISKIYFGNLAITGEHPALTFQRYCLPGGSNVIEVVVNDGNGWKTVGGTGTEATDNLPAGWRAFQVSLEDYIGKNVMIGFNVTCETFRYTSIDAIKVADAPEVEIAQVEVAAPDVLEGVFDVPLHICYANFGYKTATGVKVSVYRDGELIAEESAPDVAPLADGSYAFTDHLTPLTEPAVEYHAVVTCNGDASADNNTSATVTVNVVMPDYPVVNDLQAERSDAGVNLTWSTPVIDRDPIDLTDDFENYEAYATNKVGDWTLIDRDELDAGGFDGISFPLMGQPIPFFVMDSSSPEFNETFEAHSGTHYMASIYGTYYGWGSTSHDWLITPRLSGNAQTVRFWAKSYSPDDLETFELLYSTGGTDPSEFVSIRKEEDIAAEWTEYTAELPEGARYLAIHACSYDKFMLMIDDVTMQLESPFVDLCLEGFQLFRDGQLLSVLGADATGYSDAVSDLHAHTYHISAVYNQGLSAPSNEASVEDAALDGVTLGAVTVTGRRGYIEVNGADGLRVTVVGADGRLMADVKATSQTAAIPMGQGVYVVKAGDTVAKVVVR